MVPCVTQVNVVPEVPIYVTHALRLVQLCFLEAAIYETSFSRADDSSALHRFFVDDHEPIVGCVRDNEHIVGQAVLALYCKTLARVAQVLALGVADLLTDVLYLLSSFVLGKLLRFF